MKTPSRKSLAVAVAVPVLALVVTGCGLVGGDRDGAAPEPVETPKASPTPTSAESAEVPDVPNNQGYRLLWNEYAAFHGARDVFDLSKDATAETVNDALGWGEDTPSAFTQFGKNGACLVSSEDLYLLVTEGAGSASTSVDMGEGTDCPSDASGAPIGLASSADGKTFTVVRGADLLPSGTFIDGIASAAQ